MMRNLVRIVLEWQALRAFSAQSAVVADLEVLRTAVRLRVRPILRLAVAEMILPIGVNR